MEATETQSQMEATEATEAQPQGEPTPEAQPQPEAQAEPQAEPGPQAEPQGEPQPDMSAQAQPPSNGLVKSEQGTVLATTNDAFVLQRENGSLVRMQASPTMTMPAQGQRVTVIYRIQSMQPVVVHVEPLTESAE
jgi:hypothetical protein